MYSLTYNLWLEIIEEVVEFHAPLFEAMHQTADSIETSKALVEDLKQKGSMEIDADPWAFSLRIGLLEDRIGGFRMALRAEEEAEIFEQVKAEAAAGRGFSLDDVEGFEIEHGLEMDGDIIDGMLESYGVEAEISGNAIIFKLVVFDSQDIDNSRESNEAWEE
jgi:hypothetical protein